MNNPQLKMNFDMNVINHLGVHLYSTLPPVISELVSNAYDADAEKVCIELFDNEMDNKKIIITDNGSGLSFDEINDEYLIIGRNRRNAKSEITPMGRAVIGKKGIGKLSAFGIANKITIETNKNGYKNKFILDYTSMKASTNVYNPKILIYDQETQDVGTKVTLEEIKRKSKFDCKSLVNKLSSFFTVFNEDFDVLIHYNNKFEHQMKSEDRYGRINLQFSWKYPEDFVNLPSFTNLQKFSMHNKVTGFIATKETPIKPIDGKPGFILFARNKMVQDSMFFSPRATDLFHSYCIGDFNIDYIEDKEHPDLISTDRLSLTWEVESAEELREFFTTIEKIIQKEWRDKRKEATNKRFQEKFNRDYNEIIKDIAPEERGFIESVSNEITRYDRNGLDTVNYFIDELDKKITNNYYTEFKDTFFKIDPKSHDEIGTLISSLNENETIYIKKIALGRLAIIEKLLKLINEGEFNYSDFKFIMQSMPWLFSNNLLNEFDQKEYIDTILDFFDSSITKDSVILYKNGYYLSIYILKENGFIVNDATLDYFITINDQIQQLTNYIVSIELVIHEPIYKDNTRDTLKQMQSMNYIKITEYQEVLSTAIDFYKQLTI